MSGFWFGFLALALVLIPFSCSQCTRKPVIFNFGDSNSDTGGAAVVSGFLSTAYPDGRAFFHEPTGRLCDGRLIVDFLCEDLNTNYLTPYLESVEPDFSNGANFAIVGAATLPKGGFFTLGIQILQFKHFRNRSLDLLSKGYGQNLVGEEDFENALYTIDIGQNDLSAAFKSLSYDLAIAKIPSFIDEIKDAMWAIYQVGGRKFWVHNTGPLGCLPEKLGTTTANSSELLDQYGCIYALNQGANAFNSNLNLACQELRTLMTNATIVYVDVYSIKYNLIANSSSYGFKNPLAACCGSGGLPYNYDPNNNCRRSNFTVCEQGPLPAISWDGTHYTEAANSIVASKILSTNYSTPSLGFNFFCNNSTT
ncbi:hypothetical protein ACS0TY_002895 [Phlomoides rotata]